MKNKLFFASAIVLSLGLAACSPAEKNEEVPVESPTTVEDQKTDTTTEPATDEEVKDDLDDAKDKIDDAEDKVGDEADDLMTSDEEMIKMADYIARVKIEDVGDGLLKAALVEEYKGSLEGKEIPNDENFKKDMEYIVFLKDEAGKAVPVDDANHYRAYNGPDDEILQKIKETK